MERPPGARVDAPADSGQLLNLTSSRRSEQKMWAILNENVIRAVVAGPDVMAEQLRHIAALVRSGGALVQVLPHRVGVHATMNGMISLMRFTDAPDLAYVEAPHTGSLTDDPSLVRRYRDAYDLSRAAALPPEVSLDPLESVAEDYNRGHSTAI